MHDNQMIVGSGAVFTKGMKLRLSQNQLKLTINSYTLELIFDST